MIYFLWFKSGTWYSWEDMETEFFAIFIVQYKKTEALHPDSTPLKVIDKTVVQYRDWFENYLHISMSPKILTASLMHSLTG